MTNRRRPHPPAGLSAWAAATWRTLLDLHTFEEYERLSLTRALEWWDRSDAWLAESRTASGRDQARLTKQAMDAANCALRHWRLLKFAPPAAVPTRPGRPSGDAWSATRHHAAEALRRRLRSDGA
jgi:hypothetical protein